MRLRRITVSLILPALLVGFGAPAANAATADGHLSGVVRSANGKPAGTSKITLLNTAGETIATTTADSAGRYQVDVAEGTYTERVVTSLGKEHFVARIADVTVGADTIRNVLVAAPGLTVSGTVRDEHGAPVPAVRVSLGGSEGTTAGAATTGADGSYRLTADPGTYRVHAQFEPVPSTTIDFDAAGLVLDRHRQLDLTVRRGLQPVTVRDEQGSPVAGARPYVHSPYGGTDRFSAGFDLFPGAADTTVAWQGPGSLTDSGGVSMLPLFAADATISVWPPADRPDLAPVPETLYPAPQPNPFVIVMPAAGHNEPSPPGSTVTITGTVRDSHGNPVRDASVELIDRSATGGGIAQASVDEQGHFELTPAPGRYGLHISGYLTYAARGGDSGGPPPDLSLTIADVDLQAHRILDITIPTRSLTVHVVDRDNQPSPQSLVALSRADADQGVELFPGGIATGSLEDGGGGDTATLQVLTGVPVDVEAGWEAVLGTVTARPSDTAVTLKLTALTISGTLSDPRGPFAGLAQHNSWVSLDHYPCNPPILTGIDGQSRYSVARMPGDYILCASNTEPWDWGDNDHETTATLPEWWSIWTPYQLNGDRTVDLTVPDARSATITIVDENGRPSGGILGVNATTTKADVPLAAGLSGTGWMDDELSSDAGVFTPLLFGPSTANAHVRVADDVRGYGFSTPLAPGDELTVAIAVPAGSPGAPRDVRATNRSGSSDVTWQAPVDTGSGPITGYLVTYGDGDGWRQATVTVPATATSATLPTIPDTNANDYKIWVAAINEYGAGATTQAVIDTSDGPARVEEPPTGQPGSTETDTAGSAATSGYWALAANGQVYNFGHATHHGNGAAGAVDLEPTPTGKGYWTLNKNGTVQASGDATKLGDVDMARLASGEIATSMSATPTGRGYWIFTNRGRVIAFGDAPFLGDVSDVKLNGPVLIGSVATPSGRGYYMVASDGGIFAFGDAAFVGSMGGKKLNAPVQSLVPDSDGEGYWLVASDGGIFAFDAPFRGSMGGTRLNKPVVGMVRYGDGYLMVGADGGIFNFSTSPFAGSLGDKPPAAPVVAVAALPR